MRLIVYFFLGSDHQTFSMSLPSRLRDYYDKVVTPAAAGKFIFSSYEVIEYINESIISELLIISDLLWTFKSLLKIGASGGGVGLGTGQLIAGQLGASSGASRTHSRLTGGAIQHMVQAYSTMNRFLARFLEHVRFHFYLQIL